MLSVILRYWQHCVIWLVENHCILYILCTQQTWDVGPTPLCCWATVCDASPTANQRWANISCLLCRLIMPMEIDNNWSSYRYSLWFVFHVTIHSDVPALITLNTPCHCFRFRTLDFNGWIHSKYWNRVSKWLALNDWRLYKRTYSINRLKQHIQGKIIFFILAPWYAQSMSTCMSIDQNCGSFLNFGWCIYHVYQFKVK